MDDSKEFKNTLKNAGKVVHSTKPHIKVIDKHEVYLLDDQGRKKKRICGCQRKNMPEGYVCTNKAGAGTDHPGWGFCDDHDTTYHNGSNTSLWHKMNRKAGLPANLMEFIENSDVIEDKHLNTVDEDLRALYGLQSYLLNRRKILDADGNKTEDGFLTPGDIELFLKITDKIFKGKELRMKLKKEITLDTETVKAFINQIFPIILKNAPGTSGKQILQQILDNVIIPFKTQGRIVGNDFEFEPLAPALKDKLEK